MEGSLQNLSGEYFYSIAAVFSASAYILKNILWLRILLVIAAIIYIISGISLGITSMIGWNSAYLLINLSHVVILLLDRVTIALPEETVEIYHRDFSTLSTREFKKLVMYNEFCIFQDDMIINEGEAPDQLYIVLRGTVNVVKDGATLATLDRGDFIGEMSFLTKDAASASAYAENMVQCAFWTHADLEKMKLKNNGVYDKFIAIIGCDLVRKLKHRNDQHLDSITKLDFVV
jgi:hypothetical protein